MLFMNKDGLNSLLSDQFTLGGDASVAAGPVGRQAGASTDLKLTAQILSYSRSKGYLPDSNSRVWLSSRTRMICAMSTAQALRPGTF
jgi:hypothetical protein